MVVLVGITTLIISLLKNILVLHDFTPREHKCCCFLCALFKVPMVTNFYIACTLQLKTIGHCYSDLSRRFIQQGSRQHISRYILYISEHKAVSFKCKTGREQQQ